VLCVVRDAQRRSWLARVISQPPRHDVLYCVRARIHDALLLQTNLFDFIAKDTLPMREKLRLAMLYNLRYDSASMDKVLEALTAAGASRDELRVRMRACACTLHSRVDDVVHSR
jgi:hypothetical protein